MRTIDDDTDARRFDDFERAGRKRSLLASSLPLRRELTKFLRGAETGDASQDLKCAVVDDETLLESVEAGGSLGDEKTVDFLFHHPSF